VLVTNDVGGDLEMGERMVVCASHSPLIDSVSGAAAGRRFLDAVADAQRRIEAFAPDLVVFFGPDHARALQNIVPAATVVSSAVGYGDWGTPEDPYVVDDELARGCATALLGEAFDVALGAEMRLDHGFGQTFAQLFGSLDAVPCLPILINCSRPPLATVDRIAHLGAAVGRFAAGIGGNVLFVGSGGLSHQPPSMAKAVTVLSEEEREAVSRRTVADAARFVNPAWDERFLKTLTEGDWSTLRAISDEDLNAVGLGTHEIRTWVAAWSAAQLGAGSYTYAPVPAWITGMGVAVAPG
jgi:2,3-dihydroxyphenylpropionate 1,2-dioxygenase